MWDLTAPGSSKAFSFAGLAFANAATLEILLHVLPPALRVGPYRRFPISDFLVGSGEIASARRDMAQISRWNLVQA